MMNKSNKRSYLGRCDGVTRRDALRIGGLTSLGLGLGDLCRTRRLQAMSPAHVDAKAKACILIWLDGGPSHLETFDPKPEAPSEVRGPLDAISTSVPGLTLCECLPETAQRMHQVAIVRSMTSPLGEHNFGTHYLMTGYKPTPVLEYPAYGSVLAHMRPARGILPDHIAIPEFRVGGGNLSGGGYLPTTSRPFSVGGDPSRADFKVQDLNFYQGLDLSRLRRRKQFVEMLNQASELAQSQGSAPASQADPDLERAFQLIASEEAKQAFAMEQESAQVRRRYGNKRIGQSCLLARRLVERGVSFVTVNDRGWDTHNDLYTRLKEGYTGAKVGVGLVPSLDLALSALLDDLRDRRMLDETLVVVMGEFGRTPKLNTQGGRDHWPRVFSVLLAGGGVAGGQVIGASDAVGEGPQDRPVRPEDLAATIYSLLGIDPQTELHTADGRPVRLTPHDAQVVHELLG